MKIYIREKSEVRSIEVTEDMKILDALQAAGITSVHSPCGGNGTCKKCVVNVRAGDMNGPVLACQTQVEDGLIVELEPEVKMEVQQGGACEIYDADGSHPGLGIACDIGTTTVVCHLMDLTTGERIATVGAANAQKIFGADVIARINAATHGDLKKQQEAICEQLNRMICSLCEQTGRSLDEISYMAVCGNTTMEHLFTGLDPTGIGKAPFKPESLFGDEWDAKALGMPFDGKVYIVPSIAAYVGGDITADVLSTSMRKMGDPVLMLDIGTNGEMAMGCGNSFVCCATAAGPAFEGATIKQGMPASPGAISEVSYEGGELKIKVIGDVAPTGICGSGLVDAIATMLDLGVIEYAGRLIDADEADEETARFLGEDEDGNVFKLTPDGSVCITQSDIRQIQLAKGSIAAGIIVMIGRYGIQMEDLSELILAGGFGSYIRPKSAARIGLIPPELLEVTRAVGNAAGEGAVSAVVSAKAREDLAKCQKEMHYIELSGDKAFNDAYVEQLMFDVEEEED
ncbi:MAG: DUF4445 domain-containing protein [Lachnospiraceae bacterium]|nr:DUF4445 domain-containing protein [Lachnospiraceae bacterium]